MLDDVLLEELDDGSQIVNNLVISSQALEMLEDMANELDADAPEVLQNNINCAIEALYDDFLIALGK